MTTTTIRGSTSPSKLRRLYEKSYANIQRTEDSRALVRIMSRQGEMPLLRTPSNWVRAG